MFGQNIKIDDVLKENTPMSVRVSSKNLIPFPYFESDVERNGLAFTICTATESAAKMKGQIGISGTLSSDVTEESYIIFDNGGNTANNLQLNGPTTFSCEFQYTNNACRVEVSTIKLGGTSTPVVVTITQDSPSVVFEDVKSISNIRLVVNNTASLTTAIIRPQLEIGRIATTYAPYINNFNGIKLYKVNENLLHLSSGEKEKIIVGNGSSINSSTAFYRLPPILASSGTFKVSVDFKKLESDIGRDDE